MDESWKSIPGYEAYDVSDRGNVRRNGRVLKPGTDKGYHRCILSKNNSQTHYSIHRLVAEAFIPNPENKPTVDHINHVRSDNRVENLRWATHSEQRLYSPPPLSASGHRHISKYRNSWGVVIKRNNIKIFYKYFPTLEEAIEARDQFLESHLNSGQLGNSVTEVI